MNEKYKLSPRLRCAADMARQGAFIADVGTDHAYLPIALCVEGRICGGVASDVNDGPVERARKNINEYGLDQKISVLKTDGLSGIECYAPDDVFILGMGGELIARIIADAPWTKNGGIHLCLQPMTHAEILRAFLLNNGYSMIDETVVEEDGKIYQIILASWTGEREKYTVEELLLGRINIIRRTDALLRLARKNAETLMRRVEGKESAGENAEYERNIIERINAILREEKI